MSNPPKKNSKTHLAAAEATTGTSPPGEIRSLPWFCRSEWVATCGFLGIVAVGAFFRLHDLGLAAFRSDEGFFMDLCRQQISPGEIFGKWMQLQGLSGQFPFSAAFTKWFVDLFRMPVNHFTVHLPSALWGILTLFGGYGLGRAFAGRGFGLTLAWLLAINPYHIQISREAYHYAPLVCGAFFGVWASVWIAAHMQSGGKVTPWFYAVAALGFFLLTYSQPSGWPIALFFALTVLYGTARQIRKQRRLAAPYPILIAIIIIIGVPLLFPDWALQQQLQTTSAESKAYLLKIFGSEHPFLPALWRMVTSYACGDTFARGVFTVLILIVATAVFARRVRKDARYVLVIAFLIVGLTLTITSMKATGRPLASRYVVVLMPLYLTVLASGLVFSADILRSVWRLPRRMAVMISAAMLTLATVFWLPPAYSSTQLTGLPTPYKIINEWVDSNLPSGTLVLVDRWFEPWCELRVEPSTNVFYTYTVPDEPLEVFKQVRWRETAKNFFAQNPGAAYLEITKHYFEVPEIGPWEWPRQYFARHVAFTNVAGLKLRALGQAYREDFYAATTNRLIVELFYDREEDVIARANEEGRQFLVLYGDGWAYHKDQKTHLGWRILEGRAHIHLFNLTGEPKAATLCITATAVGGAKQILVEELSRHRFEPGKLQRWRIEPLQLPPGRTSLVLQDDLWPLAKVLLFVGQIEVEDFSVAAK